MKIREIVCPQEKQGIKCPFGMVPTRIVIHNTANDAPAINEINYMHSNENETSFHFAVDDTEAVQGIALDRNAWHAGDGRGKGNMEGIAIEICYSKSGGERFEKAQRNAAELTATLLKKYGWGIDKVTKHQDYSNKNCPHRTLEYGWDKFLGLVEEYMDAKERKESAPDVIYAAHLNGGAWLEDVKNYNDKNADGYAGIVKRAIDGIRAKLTRGTIVYRVHTVGGKYLDWVRNLEKAQGGYAGLYGKNIDGVQMYLEGVPGYAVEYRVATVGGKYLGWVRNYKNNAANGYAGIYGKPIDRIQIRIVKIQEG